MESYNNISAGSVNRIANKATAAAFFDVSVPAIDNWMRRGCPYAKRGGRGVQWELDLLEVAKWRFGASEERESNPDLLPPKERLDYYRGTQARDSLARDRLELIPFDLLDQIIGMAFAEIRSKLLSQHNSIAAEFPEIDVNAIQWILESNRAVLTRLAEIRLPGTIATALDELSQPLETSTEPDGEPTSG